MNRQDDNPMLGILLMLAFCVLAPLGDGMAKLLGPTVPLAILILTRFLIQGLVLWPLARRGGGRMWPGARLFRLTMLRTGFHIAGIATMFLSLRYLPLADALAIAFVCPFLMLILGHYVLGEHVGPHRLWACVAGFAGVLLVIQPNFLEVGLPALLPLVVALAFALFMLTTRFISREIDPLTLQTLSGFQASVVLLPVVLLTQDVPAFVASTAPTGTLTLLLLLGALGTVTQLLMTWSLRPAPGATLAPMQYLEIPFATLIGWLMFDDLPDGLAAIGILITIGAGLYIILREQAIAARPRTTQ